MASAAQAGRVSNLIFIALDSPELAVQRVKARVAAGGHNIPEETIRRRYAKGVHNFFRLYQELTETWVVYDNSVTGETIMLASGKFKDEPIIYEKENWFRFSEVEK